jgi:hypothetical protein
MSLTHVDPHVSEIVMVWIQSGDLLMVWIQISLVCYRGVNIKYSKHPLVNILLRRIVLREKKVTISTSTTRLKTVNYINNGILGKNMSTNQASKT